MSLLASELETEKRVPHPCYLKLQSSFLGVTMIRMHQTVVGLELSRSIMQA